MGGGQRERGREILALKDTLDQMEIIDLDRAFRPSKPAYTFFSRVHVTLRRIDPMLSH